VRNGVDLREIKLGDRTAYDLLQEYASEAPGPGLPTLHEALAKMIGTKEYQAMEDGDLQTKPSKLNTLANIVEQYRTVAYRRLLKENPSLAYETLRRDAVASDKLKEGLTGRPGTAEEILKALGNNPN
jgi:hypothetical protein